jgi:hypothetical protein
VSGRATRFDVFLSGVSGLVGRAELLDRLRSSNHRIERSDAIAFIDGARVRVLRGVDEGVARRVASELQALGALVELEANGVAAEGSLPSPPSADALAASLMSLDGDAAPLDARVARVADAPSFEIAPPIASAVADPDARFGPPPSLSTELELDRAAPVDEPSMVEPADSPRCPRHGLAELDGACPRCADEARPIRGRLLGGALRARPALRLGAGVVLGLLVGYIASEPYSARAQRRVAEVRALADHDRYRPLEEARANAAALDAQADAMATRAFLGASCIWLIVGGATVAGWLRVS